MPSFRIRTGRPEPSPAETRSVRPASDVSPPTVGARQRPAACASHNRLRTTAPHARPQGRTPRAIARQIPSQVGPPSSTCRVARPTDVSESPHRASARNRAYGFGNPPPVRILRLGEKAPPKALRRHESHRPSSRRFVFRTSFRPFPLGKMQTGLLLRPTFRIFVSATACSARPARSEGSAARRFRKNRPDGTPGKPD